MNKEEAHALLKEFQVPENVLRHTEEIRRAVVVLAQKWQAKGAPIDVELVELGAILHDLDKIMTLESGHHGYVGYCILMEKGEPELAELVWLHTLGFFATDKLHELKTMEQKLLNYVDKRVTEDQLVSLAERFDYLRKRYQGDEAFYTDTLKNLRAFEQELCQLLETTSAELI